MIRKQLALGVGLGLLAGACVTSETDAVGRVDQSIIGGEVANPADYPSVVALENAPGNWFCTGTLITPEWVLTAAHCVEGETPTTLNIRFGDPDVNDAAGGTVVKTSAVHVHSGYNGIAWDDDIALVKLATPVTNVTPTPIHREPVMAISVLDVGYGVADNNDGGGGILRKVSKVTSDCGGAGDPGVSNDNLLCMDASDGRGSCFGDSGGPTFATIGGARLVVGVTSGGTGELCGAGWDLYTSVHGELAFIDAILAGQPQPGGSDPDPTNPDGTDPPAQPQPDADGDNDNGPMTAGCNAGGGQAGLFLVALAGLLGRRRRRV